MPNLPAQPRLTPAEGGASVLDLCQVRENDRIMLWTRHSCYCFQVTDAAQRRGQLWRNEEPPCEAGWLGAVTATDGPFHFEPAKIRAGADALFLTSFGGQGRLVRTSAVTRVVVIRQSAIG